MLVSHKTKNLLKVAFFFISHRLRIRSTHTDGVNVPSEDEIICGGGDYFVTTIPISKKEKRGIPLKDKYIYIR